MKFFCAFIVCALLCLDSTAFADSLLAELSHRAETVEKLSGTFIQARQLTVLPLALESEGTFEFNRNEGLIWQTLKPNRQLLRITEQGVMLEGSNTVLAGSAGLAPVLLAVFSGQLNQLEELFTIQSSGDPQDWQLTMAPVSEATAAYIQAVSIRGAKNLEHLEIIEPGGDGTFIDFTVFSETRSQ